MRSWKVEGLIDTYGFLFEKPFKIGNCTIFKQKDGMRILLEIKAKDEVELEDIEKLASTEAHKFCSILSMATGRLFRFNGFYRTIETTPTAPRRAFRETGRALGLVLYPELNRPHQKEALRLYKLMKKADMYALRAVDYFQKGLTLERWNEDAFLNFYKAIELMFKKYHREANSNEIHRIYGKSKKKLNAKEKLSFMCKKLNIPSKWSSKINEIVNKRNKQDVAHATLSAGQIDLKDVFNCMAIAKLTIVNYLKLP